MAIVFDGHEDAKEGEISSLCVSPPTSIKVNESVFTDVYEQQTLC